MNLAHKKCFPCEGGVKPYSKDQAKLLLWQVPGWQLEEKGSHRQLVKEFKFKNFKLALDFINKVGELSEAEGHHPNIYLYNWNRLRLELYTHAIDGLSENDFIMAAKINTL